MPLVATERFDSGDDLSEGYSRRTRMRTFDIRDTEGLAVTPEGAKAYLESAEGVLLGAQHPQVPSLYMRTVHVGRVPNVRSECQARAEYVPLSFVLSPDDISYVGVDQDSVATTRTFWRTGPFDFLPADGELIGNDIHLEIGGTRVDIAGVPVSRVVDIGVSELFRITSSLPDTQQLRSAQGSRNEVTFLGAPPGTLLFVGASTSMIRCRVWRTVYRFAYDELFHLVQVPKYDIVGVVIDEGDDQSNPPIPPTAREVFWRQPFPGLRDFANELGLGNVIDDNGDVIINCIPQEGGFLSGRNQ